MRRLGRGRNQRLGRSGCCGRPALVCGTILSQQQQPAFCGRHSDRRHRRTLVHPLARAARISALWLRANPGLQRCRLRGRHIGPISKLLRAAIHQHDRRFAGARISCGWRMAPFGVDNGYQRLFQRVCGRSLQFGKKPVFEQSSGFSHRQRRWKFHHQLSAFGSPGSRHEESKWRALPLHPQHRQFWRVGSDRRGQHFCGWPD